MNLMLDFAKRKIQTFLIDESGPTAVEYAVMLALIIAVCVASVATMGGAVSNLWVGNNDSINSAVGP